MISDKVKTELVQNLDERKREIYKNYREKMKIIDKEYEDASSKYYRSTMVEFIIFMVLCWGGGYLIQDYSTSIRVGMVLMCFIWHIGVTIYLSKRRDLARVVRRDSVNKLIDRLGKAEKNLVLSGLVYDYLQNEGCEMKIDKK